MLLYVEVALLLVVVPLIGQRLARFDVSSLRARVAVGLALAAALPLIVIISLVSAAPGAHHHRA